MPELIAVVDTGVLCCWLSVPGRSTAGSGIGAWDNARAVAKVNRVIESGGTLILPNSVIIETGNHIAQAGHSRRAKAEELLTRIISSLDGQHPWRRFEESNRLWTREWYSITREEWPVFADMGIGLADYSIVSIARYFHKLGSEVMTLTTEAALYRQVGYLPAPPMRKRRNRI